MYRTFCIILVLLLVLPFNSPQRLGPYDIEFRLFQLCPGVKIKNPLVYNTKFSKVGRKNYTISGDIYAPHGVTEDCKQTSDLAAKTNNGFKQNFLRLGGSCINTIRQYTPEYAKLIKLPLPASYEQIKTFFYNTYKVTVNIFWKTELISCLEIIIELVPKRKKKP